MVVDPDVERDCRVGDCERAGLFLEDPNGWIGVFTVTSPCPVKSKAAVSFGASGVSPKTQLAGLW